LVEEVRRLRAAGLERNVSAARAIGYREPLAWLKACESNGKADTEIACKQAPTTEERAALVSEIAQNTWGLVRKQRTWFRNQLPPHRLVSAQAATVEELF
jgi:tRNA dimethylallyltransferase